MEIRNTILKYFNIKELKVSDIHVKLVTDECPGEPQWGAEQQVLDCGGRNLVLEIQQICVPPCSAMY